MAKGRGFLGLKKCLWFFGFLVSFLVFCFFLFIVFLVFFGFFGGIKESSWVPGPTSLKKVAFWKTLSCFNCSIDSPLKA